MKIISAIQQFRLLMCLPGESQTIVGTLHAPLYRDHVQDEITTYGESYETAMAIKVGKRYKRLWIDVNQQYVTGTVRSVSGASTWKFKYDFNDYGRITGKYWTCNSGNTKSTIPESYVKELQGEIIAHLNKTK